MPRHERFFGAARLAAVYVLVGTLLGLARPTPWHAAAGAVVVGAGEALRVWAAGFLVKNEILVTSGPYRYVRNPLYLGRLLIFSGLCVMAALPRGANWLILLGGLAVFFGYYLPRKERVEPGRLRALHGAAYERYRREVPSLFPLRGAWEEDGTVKWSAGRALRNREHWMVLGLLAAIAWAVWRACRP